MAWDPLRRWWWSMSLFRDLPFGGLLFAVCTALAIVPLRRPRIAATASWLLAMVPSEVPGFVLAVLVVGAAPPVIAGDVTTTRARLALALAGATAAGLVAIAIRATRTRAVTAAALDRGLPDGWRSALGDAGSGPAGRRRLTWQLVVPWPRRPRTVERCSDVAYGPHGRANRLDVYRHRRRPDRSPALIHLHGGRFRWGAKSRESRSLLHRFAEAGWTCISADYRLAPDPGEAFPASLVDAKRVVAWARTEGRAHGVDPDMIVMAGSSAGAHLMAMTALTAGIEDFQPGFEDADTSIAAGIGLYGYYGRLGGPHDSSTSPLDHLAADAPPLLLLHGTNDTYTPLAGARALADGVAQTSTRPVVLAELPGAQHSFDVFPSIRGEGVIEAIDEFTTWVRSSATADR